MFFFLDDELEVQFSSIDGESDEEIFGSYDRILVLNIDFFLYVIELSEQIYFSFFKRLEYILVISVMVICYNLF